MTEIERLKEEVERLIVENKRCFGMGRWCRRGAYRMAYAEATVVSFFSGSRLL